MYGDLSWPFRLRLGNLVAPIDQQGRVLTDRDGNARTALVTAWQDTAARSAFGAEIAAVPSFAPKGLEVATAAADASGKVTIGIRPGLAWCDGLLATLAGDPATPVNLMATPLSPPLQNVPADLGGAGTRDVVVLELWRESLSAFQDASLLEPALGGPDTTLRLQTAMALRLFRLAAGEHCDDVRDRLADDLSKRGTLTVSLSPTTTTSGDCPEITSGGYVGFEHDLYRIEIAALAASVAGPMFKWSRQNGGLVGRAKVVSVNQLQITQNAAAILSSDQSQFYLEVVTLDPSAGHYAPVFGSRVTLGTDDLLSFAGTPFLGTVGALPAAPQDFFIRLWDDIGPISDFPAPGAKELRDGIQLRFDGATADNYQPGDYWTFPVRAGLVNPNPLVDHAVPEGVEHHRVPLAEVTWPGGGATAVPGKGLEDCRVVFNPLGATSGCCTLRVGPNGDFARIQDAVDALPESGGRVCVMPGDYQESVLVSGRHDVWISGCGFQTLIRAEASAGEFAPSKPVFHVIGSRDITLENMVLTAGSDGIGVLIEAGTPPVIIEGPATEPFFDLERVRLDRLEIHAAAASAVDQRGGKQVTLSGNRILMTDMTTQWPAVALTGTDGVVERNVLTVVPHTSSPTHDNGDEPADPAPATAALGGLWLRGGCQNMRVVDNLIRYGRAHGIILGDVVEEAPPSLTISTPARWLGWVFGAGDDCAPREPASTLVPTSSVPGGPTLVAGDPLTDIWIERNRILDMGLAGIGVYGFFDDNQRGIITVDRLTVLGNEIRSCLARSLKHITSDTVDMMGYGAISLADVTQLVVRDNAIEDNGPDGFAPNCGLFALVATGAEIMRNRILNNGARTADTGAAPGPRGGIFIFVATSAAHESTSANKEAPSPAHGVAAARIHENVVDVPLGRAVTIGLSFGPVSIVANSLTSRGVPQSPTLESATVSVVNAGLSVDRAGAGGFSTLASGKRVSGTFTVAPLPMGPVLVAQNHVQLLGRGAEMALASLGVVSLDDVQVEGNQFLAHGAFVWFQDYLVGATVRATGNRLQEDPGGAFLSALTFGNFNITAFNEGTHCIVAGSPNAQGLVDGPNLVPVPELCKTFAELIRGS